MTKPTTKPATAPDDNAEFLRLLRSGPIADFAKYMGGDLDLAVQLRIDEAVSAAYDKVSARQGTIAEGIYNDWSAEQAASAMEIHVRPIAPQGNLYGFASVTVSGIKIDDFKIVKNKDGVLFVGMPSKPDRTSRSGYRSTVFVDREILDSFNSAVIAEYQAALQERENNAAPERIAAQMARAKNEAENQSAVPPAKVRTAPARSGRGD